MDDTQLTPPVKEAFLESQRALIALVTSVIILAVVLFQTWLGSQSADLQASIHPLAEAVKTNAGTISTGLVSQAILWGAYILGRTIRNTK